MITENIQMLLCQGEAARSTRCDAIARKQPDSFSVAIENKKKKKERLSTRTACVKRKKKPVKTDYPVFFFLQRCKTAREAQA